MIRETTAELPHVLSTRARAEDQPRLLANVQRGWRTFDVTCAEGVFHLNLFPAEMKPDLPCEPLLLDAYAHACAQGETPAVYVVQVFSDEELAQLPLEPERLSFLHLLWDD